MKDNDLWKLSFSKTMKLFSLLFTETKWQELQVIQKQTEHHKNVFKFIQLILKFSR